MEYQKYVKCIKNRYFRVEIGSLLGEINLSILNESCEFIRTYRLFAGLSRHSIKTRIEIEE